MCPAFVDSEPLMATFTDTASLEALLAALMKRQPQHMNDWERRAVLDLTTLSLVSGEVLLPVAPGAGATKNAHPIDLERIKHILLGIIKEEQPPRRTRRAARVAVVNKLPVYRHLFESRFAHLWDSEPTRDLLHFQMTLTLPFDARRFGGLIDDVTLKNVATLFDWPNSDYQNVKHYVKNTELLDQWQRYYSQSKRLSEVPQILLRACIQACMVRGLYYTELSRRMGIRSCWHPTRDYVVDRYESPFLKAPRSVKYVVGMIIIGAMQENNSGAICELWASNIKRARAISLCPLEEDDDTKAQRAAIEFAMSAGLIFRSKRLDRILTAVQNCIIEPALLLAGLVAHPHVPITSPDSIFQSLRGPIKYRVNRFAEKHAKKVYGQQNEYRDLLEHGVKHTGKDGLISSDSELQARWPGIRTSDSSLN